MKVTILILIVIAFGFMIYVIKEKQCREEIRKNNQCKKEILKFKEYYELLDQWMINLEQGMCAENYFVKNNYQNIAIYGMGPLGFHLYQQLRESKKIHVLYAIDQKGTSVFPELVVKKPTESLSSVDAIIITVTSDYGSIASMLEKQIDCSMISLEEVVCEF